MTNVINMQLPELPYAVEEALNRLRINIKFCGKNTKKILIASSVPDEGKSFVAIQLWRLLGEAGFKSALVDIDLRKSILRRRHRFESQEEIIGLDYYLSGQVEYEDVIYKTNIANADIVPCTNVLENPSALLEDPRLEELFDQLSQDYRYVIVDAPPLVSVADAVLIAALCDGAILVVNSKETSRNLLRQSINQLERTDCKLLGTVLNKADAGSHAYHKYYSKYGGYGYYGPERKS